MAASEFSLGDWLATLPATERKQYRVLITRLQQVGDPEKLAVEERQQLTEMASRYAAAEAAGRATDEEADAAAEAASDESPAAKAAARLNRQASMHKAAMDQATRDQRSRDQAPVGTAPVMQPISSAFLQSEFVAFVREILNRDWCARGGTLQDAVLHSFEQKWLPDELRDEQICAQLYRRYQRDIDQANGFRQGLPGNKDLVGDKRMAVGLAWFTTVYKMHQLLLQGIDPDS